MSECNQISDPGLPFCGASTQPTGAWNVHNLLRALAARGQQPAVIEFRDGDIRTWGSKTLAREALHLARGLHQLDTNSRVVLWAPNSPRWIASALAVLASGHILVPLDDMVESSQLDAALAASKPGLILTSANHAKADGEILKQHGARVILLDTPEPVGAAPKGLRQWLENLPVPGHDAPVLLSWTSGTTGSPKAFLLTHGNIAVNIAALRDLAIVGPDDRALLPLPLHHAYPFVVGMLTPLTLGTAIVLPGGTTGPTLSTALRDARVTAVVGVPRLYEVLIAAVEAQVSRRGRSTWLAWQAMLRGAKSVQRWTGVPLGRLLFAPLRRRIAPHLRLLVSGGAHLERGTEETLEALGWTVLSGYGLAETASLFTGNRPGERRSGSAGRPLAGGEVRIAGPDERGIGEIELRGGSITSGYIDNPEANHAAYTPDGWFRTGDLGFVDHHGFLFVTGRTKETLVLGGGKKVNPEDLERVYGVAPEIAELAVLEHQGGLVALVRPDPAKLRARGATNLRDGIRIVLGEKAQGLPSYQRLSGFALTDQPLPRTRLGKYRRFLLPQLYEQAAGGIRRAARVLGAEDAALLREPTAAAVWELLQLRFPGQATDLDVNLGLDLNLDSFGWMELAVLLQHRLSVHLSETDIDAIQTVRDLLRRSIERGARRSVEAPAIATDIDRWLAPRGLLLHGLGTLLYALNWLVMRCLFRLSVTGTELLPASGPFVITPNHGSYLDAPAIAAALPFRRIKQLYWAGDIRLLFSNPLVRTFSRALHVFPVDPNHPAAALGAANRVLQAAGVPVWFPEGWRSPDGTLQRFLPGIGELLLKSGAPAVPAYITGAFEALPRTRRIPRFRQISVMFGHPVRATALLAKGTGQSEEEKVVNALRDQIFSLSNHPER